MINLLGWSVAATSASPEAAADLFAFFVTDPEAGRVLGVERGVPISSRIREVVMPLLNEVEQATGNHVNLLADKVSAYPPPPRGSSEFDRNVMRRVADEVAFDRVSVADGASQHQAEAARFVDYMVSRDGARLWATVGGRVPTRRSVLEAPFFAQPQNAWVRTMVQAWQTRTWIEPTECNTRTLQAILNDATAQVVLSNADPTAALRAAEARFTEAQ